MSATRSRINSPHSLLDPHPANETYFVARGIDQDEMCNTAFVVKPRPSGVVLFDLDAQFGCLSPIPRSRGDEEEKKEKDVKWPIEELAQRLQRLDINVCITPPRRIKEEPGLDHNVKASMQTPENLTRSELSFVLLSPTPLRHPPQASASTPPHQLNISPDQPQVPETPQPLSLPRTEDNPKLSRKVAQEPRIGRIREDGFYVTASGRVITPPKRFMDEEKWHWKR